MMKSVWCALHTRRFFVFIHLMEFREHVSRNNYLSNLLLKPIHYAHAVFT